MLMSSPMNFPLLYVSVFHLQVIYMVSGCYLYLLISSPVLNVLLVALICYVDFCNESMEQLGLYFLEMIVRLYLSSISSAIQSILRLVYASFTNHFHETYPVCLLCSRLSQLSYMYPLHSTFFHESPIYFLCSPSFSMNIP